MRSNSGSSGYSHDVQGRSQSHAQGAQPNFASSGRSGGQAGQGFGSGQDFGGSPHDQSYRRWREQQIAQLDSEYDEYCRHRQQQFEQDFSSFRQTRQSGQMSGSQESGSQMGGGSSGGGHQFAGSTTTGSGMASAATASTGSSNADAESGSDMAGAGSSSRSGKSR
jgi:hypothetical protein